MTEQDVNKVKIITLSETGPSGRERETALEEHKKTEPMKVSGTREPGEKGPEAEADPLEAAKREAEENRDRWIRSVADLENYKKRALQERSNLLKYRNEELLRDFLPVLDNMERALAHCEESGRSDSLTEGVCLVVGMFREVLERYGVKEIKALGEAFDPHLHEAIARSPAEGMPPNVVVQELEKGYMYQDRLLRPAKVVVSVAGTQ
ncbi:MAG: nucleotide exchange factor GrpE [Desulfomonile tiedjei]|nr:nucleotide exchange factor GrpE [Desulfomonile tiedjei]